MKTNKLSDDQVVRLSPVKTQRVLHTDNLMMSVWDFSDGPWDEPEPFHSHPHEQVVYLAAGEVMFTVGEGSTRLRAGDMIAVPGDIPHTIQLLTPVVRIIDTWTPVRQEFL